MSRGSERPYKIYLLQAPKRQLEIWAFWSTIDIYARDLFLSHY